MAGQFLRRAEVLATSATSGIRYIRNSSSFSSVQNSFGCGPDVSCHSSLFFGIHLGKPPPHFAFSPLLHRGGDFFTSFRLLPVDIQRVKRLICTGRGSSRTIRSRASCVVAIHASARPTRATSSSHGSSPRTSLNRAGFLVDLATAANPTRNTIEKQASPAKVLLVNAIR
jgi:hypothetical protein